MEENVCVIAYERDARYKKPHEGGCEHRADNPCDGACCGVEDEEGAEQCGSGQGVCDTVDGFDGDGIGTPWEVACAGWRRSARQ